MDTAFPDTAVPLATFAYPAWGDNNDSQADPAPITWALPGTRPRARSCRGEADMRFMGTTPSPRPGCRPSPCSFARRQLAFRGTSLSVPVYVTVGSQLSLAANPMTSTELSSGGMVDVAHFTDTDPGAVSGDFTATVAWASPPRPAWWSPPMTAVLTFMPWPAAGERFGRGLFRHAGQCGRRGLGQRERDSFIMDDGTTLTLDGLPGGNDSTVINGSTLDLDGNSVAVKTVTLTAGSINDGAVAASQYYAVRNGSIAANLGGPLTLSGGGEVDLTGNNSFSGTTIEGGTLGINSGAVLAGPVTFAGPGTILRSTTCRSLRRSSRPAWSRSTRTDTP